MNRRTKQPEKKSRMNSIEEEMTSRGINDVDEKKEEDEEKLYDGELGREELPPVEYYIDSGCSILNFAISNSFPGGLPGGRIIHIVGDESTSKSVFCQEAIGYCHRKNGKGIYEDAEGTLDFGRSREIFGCNKIPDDPYKETEFWKYNNPSYIEELFDVEVESQLQQIEEHHDLLSKYSSELNSAKGKKKTELKESIAELQKIIRLPRCMAIDSLTSIGIKEDDIPLDEKTYGMARAKKLGVALRKYRKRIATKGLSLLVIDQSRANKDAYENQPWYDKMTWSGGKPMRFYASTRIMLRDISKILNRNKTVVGVKFEFFIHKNKVAPPFRGGEFRLLFDYGIDDIGSNIEFYKKHTGGERKSAWFELSFSDKKFQTLDDAIDYVEDNNYEEELRKDVWELWNNIHQPVDRKPKRRL